MICQARSGDAKSTKTAVFSVFTGIVPDNSQQKRISYALCELTFFLQLGETHFSGSHANVHRSLHRIFLFVHNTN
jgi:hypothetical protein